MAELFEAERQHTLAEEKLASDRSDLAETTKLLGSLLDGTRPPDYFFGNKEAQVKAWVLSQQKVYDIHAPDSGDIKYPSREETTVVAVAWQQMITADGRIGVRTERKQIHQNISTEFPEDSIADPTCPLEIVNPEQLRQAEVDALFVNLTRFVVKEKIILPEDE
jgi:hypothetical protein